ncbi:MAG: sugar transferase [Plesiomonas sp.]|uniref:sugar transferase n=1 Tax=Plesiomonas sp. TaxID=2486279 RepID=UPI003F3A8CAC
MSHYVHPVTAFAKRMMDIIGALFGILLTLPLWPLIAIAIKLESKGPIFFKQQRVGRIFPDHVELFYMIKFRSMRQDAEATSGAVWATKNDPRITRIGHFLRKTRLDELPQFINVIRGDMSLIGPRPERPHFCNTLEDAIPFYVERTYGIAPGITGLAQVNQGYDESLDDVRSKLAYDLAYSLALTRPWQWLKLDLNIAWRTIKVMVGKRGQ